MTSSHPAPPYGIQPTGYRLPDETHVGTVHLQVSNLARSLAYYVDVLGLRVLLEKNGQAALGSHGRGEATLVELHENPGVRPVPRRGLLGLYHFAILLPDRSSLGRFVSHLARLRVAVGSAEHLVSEALYLYDPDGLGIEVYRDRPRAEWPVNGRELVMAVEPLDLQDVAGAGGDALWTGMPAGTTVGHVHLYVGSLPDAEAFYHRALGLDKTLWSFPGALFLSAGGYHHHLGTNTWAASAPPAGDDDARLLYWDLVLPTAPDVSNAVRHLADSGHRAESTAMGSLVADPWGTRVRLTHAPDQLK